MDSDISVDPETLKDFFEIIEKGRADFVNGTRFVYKMEKGAMRKLNNIGNLFFQFIISIVISSKLTDSLCGTKIFKKEMIKKILGTSNFWLKIHLVTLILYLVLHILAIKFLNIPYITGQGCMEVLKFRFSDGVKLYSILSTRLSSLIVPKMLKKI